MPQPTLRDLDAIKYTSSYPQGAVLFMEKQSARGIYVICEGEVKLSVSSADGKTLILRIAKAGDVLGLTAALSGASNEVTAEVLRPCQVAFVRREDFLRFLSEHAEVYRTALTQVAGQYQTACEQIRTIGLSASVTEKVARLLLDWCAGSTAAAKCRTTMPLTHEEIAEFVGTTRESVTRTLSDFKRRQLIQLHGSTLTIPSVEALASCARP
ncbi:MAG TPA: Crp/Fnr family transcriptional regulator [Candidatus Aquilonibacter sp.]|nr:Crp/Fnr family transcriptional regulator [Candidatus Aquilonibacter sp.]